MELAGSKTLAMSSDSVWQALNDPSVLIQCLPGCESFERVDEHMFELVLAASVGPITARFMGKLSLSDLNPPHGYSLNFSGSGGAAGAGKGSAVVTLAPQGADTVLSYTVKAHVSGRLAQVGSRLIDGVAGKMAEEFFARFSLLASPQSPLPAELENVTHDSSGEISNSKAPVIWAVALSVLMALLGAYWFLH
jgi:carbon monoxide dehydrogenase subunit G